MSYTHATYASLAYESHVSSPAETQRSSQNCQAHHRSLCLAVMIDHYPRPVDGQSAADLARLRWQTTHTREQRRV